MVSFDRCDEETCWVEPWLSHPVRQVVSVDQRLLGMMCECGGIDPQPLLLILTGYESPDLYAGRDHGFRQLHIEPPFHDQQLALAGHPGSFGEGPCGRTVTHCPHAQRATRLHDQPLQQQGADALPPMFRSNQELACAPLAP